MANTTKPTASPKAIKDSSKMWDNFILASKICGGLTCVILIIMALTLV